MFHTNAHITSGTRDMWGDNQVVVTHIVSNLDVLYLSKHRLLSEDPVVNYISDFSQMKKINTSLIFFPFVNKEKLFNCKRRPVAFTKAVIQYFHQSISLVSLTKAGIIWNSSSILHTNILQSRSNWMKQMYDNSFLTGTRKQSLTGTASKCPVDNV